MWLVKSSFLECEIIDVFVNIHLVPKYFIKQGKLVGGEGGTPVRSQDRVPPTPSSCQDKGRIPPPLPRHHMPRTGYATSGHVWGLPCLCCKFTKVKSYLRKDWCCSHSQEPPGSIRILRRVYLDCFEVDSLFPDRYFGVCFLNQLILSKRESVLASKLVLLYFSFFKVSFVTVQPYGSFTYT